jgi:sugar lactone lactonase YvrE
LLLALLLAAAPAGAVDPPEFGELILLDRGWPTGGDPGALLAVDPAGTGLRPVTYFAAEEEFAGVAWGPEKQLYVGDGATIRVADAYDSLTAGARTIRHPYFSEIVSLARDEAGGLLVLDRSADPLGEGYQGALFLLDPATDLVSLIASDSLFVAPEDLVLETGGTVLVMDAFGRMSAGAPGTGALFRVDPETHSTEPLFSLSFAQRAAAIALRDEDTLLLLDAQAVLPEHPDARGAVYLVSLESGTVIDTLGAAALREPVDMLVIPGDELVIVDRTANPDGYAGHQGVVARIELASGELLGLLTDARFTDLRSVAFYSGADLDASRVTIDGFPETYVLPGMHGRLTADLVNRGGTAADLRLEVVFDSLRCLFGTAEAASGTLSFESGAERFGWEGTLAAGAELQVAVEVLAPEALTAGSGVSLAIDLVGEALARRDTLRYTVGAGLEPGQMVFADPYFAFPAPQLFILDSTGYQPVEWVADRFGLLPEPVDLAIGPDGWVYVLDSDADRPKVVSVDPVDRSLTVLYEGTPLVDPSGICLAHDGALLIADPRGRYPEATPGAIFRLDPQTGELTTFFESEDSAVLGDPVDIGLDIGGHYLVADYQAAPEAPRWGSVIELDGDGAVVGRVTATGLMDDPYSLAIDSRGRIYVTDIDPDRPSVIQLTRLGAGVFNFRRLASPPQDTLLVEPVGIVALGDDEYMVCDARDNPFYPERGGLLRLFKEGSSWNLVMQSFHFRLGRPRRAACFRQPEIIAREFAMVDRDGGRLAPGDTLDVSLVLDNDEQSPGLGVGGVLSLGPSLHLVSAQAGSGDLRAEPLTEALHWTTDIAFRAPESLQVVLRVDSLAVSSSFAEIALQIVGGADPALATLRDTISGPLPTDEILVLDAAADPFGVGDEGALFLYDQTAAELRPYASHPAIVDPQDMVVLDDERIVMIATHVDPEGVLPPRPSLKQWNLVSDSVTTLALGTPLESPVRMLPHPEGGYWILDEQVASQTGIGRGAVFYLPAGGGSLEFWARPEAFRRPIDMAVAPNGDLWVADLRANPGSFPVQNSGAFFIFDAESGALIDTLANPELADPQGLAWVAGEGLYFSDPIWHIGGDTGIRRIDERTREIEILLTAPEFGTPTRSLVREPDELLVVDSTAQPAGGSENGAVWRIDRQSGALLGARQHASLARAQAIARIPSPAIGIRRWEALRASAEGFIAGDTLSFRLVLENSSALLERAALAAIELSGPLLLDPLSGAATAGEVDLAEKSVSWHGPLAAGDSVIIDYRLTFTPRAPGATPWVVQDLTLSAAQAEGRTARLRHCEASATGEGEILVADARANPLGDGVARGAVFRLEGPTREPVPVVVSEVLSEPVRAALWPESETELLVLDADAPGPAGGEGGLFLASTRTGAVTPIFQDSSLVEPIAFAVLDSSLCYVLDRDADPLGLSTGMEPGPGALYAVDLETGAGRLIASDARFVDPVDLLLHRGSGMLYIVDRSAVPGGGGFTGGVFSVDPVSGNVMTYWLGDPFHSPRCGAWGPAGELLVVERTLTGGEIYHLPGDAPPVLVTSSALIQDPRGLRTTEGKRLMIVDGVANPGGDPGPTGSLLRFTADGELCQLYRGGPPFRRPHDIAVHYEGTPVAMIALALAETAGGVELRWTPPPAMQGADFYVYRRTPEIPGAGYALRNPDAPVRGEGALRYIDAGVAAGTLYEYMLLAVLLDGSRHETQTILIRTSGGRWRFFLTPPVPNPMPLLAAGEGLLIRFGLASPAREARLALYDVSGRRVREFMRGPAPGGPQSLRWDGRDQNGAPVGSGVFFLRLAADGRLLTRRLVLLR